MATDMVNYYLHCPKAESRTYPNEDQINIKLPFRAVVIGPSGSGKTVLVLNIIKKIGTFDKIVVLARDLTEPLYAHLIKVYEKIEKKLNMKVLLAISDIKDIPAIEDFDPKENALFIVDDFITEGKKNLDIIGAFWIRARKKGVSMIFLSQAYYCIPKLIRQNSSYIFIKKIDTPKDLRMMLKEYSLGVDVKQLSAMYDEALKGDAHTSFFLIDTGTTKASLRFRANFRGLLPD